jgi:hypothetical protein
MLRFVFYTICLLGDLVKIFSLTISRYKNMNNIIELKYSVFDKKNNYNINFGVEKTLHSTKNL